MDKLKLAQFKKITNSSDNLGCEFLKRNNINLNYYILDDSCRNLGLNSYRAGYSYLHYAAENFDLASINELIKRKVDLVQQGCKDGCTPLHIVAESSRDSFKSEKVLFSTYESVTNYVGKLRKNKFVETLLAAQIEAGVTKNPKNAKGTSHLHIACTYNHIKAVQLFLNAGEPVDHATNDKHKCPGYTALHFAIKYSSLEVAEILLNHGANIFLRDLDGKSALDWLIVRLLDIADFLAVGDRTYYPFYEQERDKLEYILCEILKTRGKEDGSDDCGLTWLHVRCVLNDSSAVKSFFKQNLDVNCTIKNESKCWPGWTPLHFAACFNIDTFKFLLLKGADLSRKNANGETPLDFCMQRYDPYIVHSILSTKEEFKNILLSDGITKLLDVLLIMNNNTVYVKWFDNLKNVDVSIPSDSPIWPGYNLLHLAVLNERIKPRNTKLLFEAAGLTFTSDSVIDDELMKYWKGIMNRLLSSRCSFNKNNADGFPPFIFALHKHKITFLSMILNKQEENVNSNGLSYFHIACAMGNMEAIERFQNNRVNLNEYTTRKFEWYNGKDDKIELIPAYSTPLHIAVIFQNERLVKYLLEKGADMHLNNYQGVDPFQLAFINENRSYLRLTNIFLRKMVESRQFTIKGNLHCLHIATFCEDETIIKKLLEYGVDTEICFEPLNPELKSKFSKYIGKTSLHIAISNLSSRVTEALINGGADILGKSSKSTEKLLSSALQICHYNEECFGSKLKQKKRYVIKPIDTLTGLTTLHIACKIRDVKWAKSLLKKGADPNCRLESGIVFDVFTNWPGGTPLTVFAEGMRYWDNKIPFVELLLSLIEHGADVTITNNHGKSPLHILYYETNDRFSCLCSKNYIETILSTLELLLKSQKSHDINPTDHHGLSHFHLACYVNNLEIVKGMLDAGIDVNHEFDPFVVVERHAGYTPLHFALDRKNLDVACLLIERGANVKAEDLLGDTPLHVALKQEIVDARLIELMSRHGLDINAKNAKGITPIEYLFATKTFTLEQLDVMLSHGAVIDLINVKPSGRGVIGLAISNAEPNERHSIFKRIINSCNLENVIRGGFNVIDSAVNVEQKGQVTVEIYLNVLDQLIDAGCDVDQKDQEGKTALHRATSLFNYEAVKALLLVGANLDIVDKNGETSVTKEVMNNNRYYMRDRQTDTLEFLTTQIWKMRNISLGVSKPTEIIFSQMIKKFCTFESRVNRNHVRTICLNELENVRKTFINQLSLFDFLSDSEAVIRYSTMPITERQAIDAFFKCRDNIRQGFPEWAGFLIMQYRKAVARVEMLKPAMQVLFSAGIKLPALCLGEIVEYLNYAELKLLVADY